MTEASAQTPGELKVDGRKRKDADSCEEHTRNPPDLMNQSESHPNGILYLGHILWKIYLR